MSYEIDILAVGEESKSGDAIALRFGNFMVNPNNQKVVVIDGGFADSGEKLVERIINTYGTNRVDLVISTHPDADHINGLGVILEKLQVGELWMHTPWNMSDNLKSLAEYRGLSQTGSVSKLKKSLEAAYDLEKLAEKKGIKIVEPFEDLSFENVIYVIGPSLDYYFELTSQFDEPVSGLSLSSFFQKAKNTITELWHEDQLAEPDENAVSARNNSSVVTVLKLDDNFLFVGDAGTPALVKAADYAESQSFDLLSNIKYHHVPHHGSKRNLGPKILNRIVGPILPEGQKSSKTTFISASKDSLDHPSKRVTNALNRRGATVTATCGQDHCFHSLDVPVRQNWGPITPVAFLYTFEEEE